MEKSKVWKLLVQISLTLIGLIGVGFVVIFSQVNAQKSFHGRDLSVEQVNLALNKPATQSSDYADSLGKCDASLAVDGNTEGYYSRGRTMSHTLMDTQAWWQVDLGSLQAISSINIYNRSDCCGDRLSDFYVLISEAPFPSNDLATLLSQSGVFVKHVSGQAGRPTALEINQPGRYVRIQLAGTNYLSLVEVQVWGGAQQASPTIEILPTDTQVSPTEITPDPTETQTDVAPTEVSQGTEISAGQTVVVSPGTSTPILPTPSALMPTATNQPATIPSSGNLINLALRKPAIQSSTYRNSRSIGTASLAVDGNTEGNYFLGLSISHTLYDPQAWWQVDLGSIQAITTVKLWNRSDCCSERLSNFYVLVSDVPFISNDLETTRKQPGVSAYYFRGNAARSQSIDIQRSGRYVRIQLSGSGYLSLAEVQVWGGGTALPKPTEMPPVATQAQPTPSEAPPTATAVNQQPILPTPTNVSPATLVNLALKKPASQSSNYNDSYGAAYASRAVDGNTNGRYSNLSVSHTLSNAQAWWQVDLGSVQSISTIHIWNRTDCCGDRLGNFYVLVSDAPFSSTNLNTSQSQPGVSAYFVNRLPSRMLAVEINRTGRYVRIQLSGSNYLSLSEVQVWGQVSQPKNQPTPIVTATPVTQPQITQMPTAVPITQPTNAPPVSGAYYVATNGSDSNPGTIEKPWRTLNYASKRLHAGETLYVRGGTYKEETDWSTDGTSSQPITIKAYPGEKVVIDGENRIPARSGGNFMFMVWGDWYIVDGIEIKRSNDEGAIGVRGAHVVIRNCFTHHNYGSGITMMGDYGLAEGNRVWYNGMGNEYMRGSGWPAALTCARYPSHCTLRGNTSWENWGEGISTFEAYYTTIENNISYNNMQNIYISDTKYTVVQGNLVYCTEANVIGSYVTQNGILLGDERRNPASSNNTVINNIVIGCERNLATSPEVSSNSLYANNTFVNAGGSVGERANILIYTSGRCTNCRFENNLVLQQNSIAIALGGGTNNGWSFSNNLWSKNPPTNFRGTSDLIGDPKLAQRGSVYSPEWHSLLTGSPAIDKGKPGVVLMDFAGNARTGTMDIGAFQFK